MYKNAVSLLAILSVIIIIAISCEHDDELPQEIPFIQLDSIKSKYLIGHENWGIGIPVVPPLSGVVGNHNVSFLYRGNAPYKRVNGPLGIINHDLFEYFVDTVQQVNDSTFAVYSYSTNPEILSINPGKREFTVVNGLLTKKIIYFDDQQDTVFYQYDQDRKLVKTIETRLNYYLLTREFQYDVNGNLLKIVGTEKGNDSDFIYFHTEENFGGYDSHPNKLHGRVSLWEDMLYLTLSVNNFTSYSYSDGGLGENHNWELTYDDEGYMDYTK